MLSQKVKKKKGKTNERRDRSLDTMITPGHRELVKSTSLGAQAEHRMQRLLFES